MNQLSKRLANLWRDEKAAEVTELGIVLALIVAGAIATITLIGPKITKFYQDVNADL